MFENFFLYLEVLLWHSTEEKYGKRSKEFIVIWVLKKIVESVFLIEKRLNGNIYGIFNSFKSSFLS